MTDQIEYRAFSLGDVVVERREDDGDEELLLSGHAAVFDHETTITGLFREVIRPGAFRRAIREKQDVALLLNHDPSTVMARISNETLSLREDTVGLHFEARLDPQDTDARRTFWKVARGNIRDMSFGFQARKEAWEEEGDGELPLRELHDVDLYDVSPVTHPAYSETDVQAREYARGRSVVPPRPAVHEDGAGASRQELRRQRKELEARRLSSRRLT